VCARSRLGSRGEQEDITEECKAIVGMSPTNTKVGATPHCVENLGVMQNCNYSCWLKGLKSL